ncbi:HlyD family secretion protein [Sulfuriferula thiophila]|uniref:HlyD family secretion protein n=1 Tax=Sulfuriferula thiophila TaxID=1781211 RepID=UPI0016752C7D|nr:HlyD family secretion protein [Sulfuriferula thiophila]
MNNPASNKLRRHLFIGGGILIAVLITLFYFTGGRIVSTDNAYVQAAHVDISANIAGRVTQVFVKENQQVHQGDPLFALDNRDYLIAIQDANAKLTNARLQTAALQATYTQRQADTQAAIATLRYQIRELDRQKILAGKGISSQEQLEMAQHAVDDATQKLNAAKQQQNNIHALLGNAVITHIDAHPDVQQAQATLERAQLNLSYTIIKAPMDGIVSKVDQLQPGKYINAATPVFSLISNKVVWVEANFKETQLAYMRAGQKVTINVDAYPDHSFHGRISSIGSGTGASFALLPPENATGNWVKVVQRLPVSISIDALDPKYPLRSGLSAVVDVDTQHSRLKTLL